MDSKELRERLESSHKATLLYLVASGLKAGGELEILPFKNEVKHISDIAKSVDLSYYIHHMQVLLKVPRDRLEEVQGRLENDNLPYTMQKLTPDFYRLIVPNSPGRILFWRNMPSADPLLSIFLYDTRISYRPFARFLGYPQCCVDNFRGKRSVREFNTALQERYQAKGIEGIEHLIGLFHVPCDIDCAETRKLGYSTFLKETAPELYEEIREYELARAIGKVKFIEPTPDINPFEV